MTLQFILLYNFIRVPLYLIFKIAGFFNAKIRTTMAGRRGLFEKLGRDLEQIPGGSTRLWIHMSSMGEFEQGAPLIDEMLSRFPTAWIIVSLFSPSVYDHLDYQKDRVITTYLPLDHVRHVSRFVSMIKPSMHLIVRHDIWPNYQWFLYKRNIPSLLVDASFSETSFVWAKRLRAIYAQLYATFSTICTVSELNTERIEAISGHRNVISCGDTRYDRVYARAMDTTSIAFLHHLNFQKAKCVVIGSSWPEDEKVILPAMLHAMQNDDEMSAIIAPHEISQEHLKHLEKYFQSAGIKTVRLSSFKSEPTGCRVLLVDSIGLLANLYSFAALAYVGGGFGAGVHSVLEPAAHGAVVCYGPLHENSPEAQEMTALNLGQPITRKEQFERLLLTMLQEPDKIAQLGSQTKTYVLKNVGASQRTADAIENILRHY